MKEFYMEFHGKGKIACHVWEPEGQPRGVVQLVHGIAEYVQRYDHLARFLNSKGYVVVGEDHMGHGGSISAETPQGCFCGGWLAAVDDTYALMEKTRREYPQLPYFIYGHSMGSFMTRTLLYRYPEAGLSAAILCGTGWQPGIVLKVGRLLCRLEAKKHGRQSVSPLIGQLMFGGYNKHFTPHRTDYDWISSDAREVDKYCADPLAGFDASIGLADDMLGGMQMNETPKNLAKMPKALPVLFISGDCDPVGSMGKGVKKTAAAFRKAGMEQVTVKLYPGGRHEIHNETNRDEVFADAVKFFDSHCPSSRRKEEAEVR